MKRATQMSKRLAVISAAFCVCSSVAWDSSSTPRNDNSVTSLNYSQESARTLVEIGVLSDPTFSVYTLKNPERVVVEILDCNSSARISPIQVRNGIIDTAAVSVSQSSDYSACRVILGLEKETTYAVDSTKDRITIALDGRPAMNAAQLAQAYKEMEASRDQALASAREMVAREQVAAQNAKAETLRAQKTAQDALSREKIALAQLEKASQNAQSRESDIQYSNKAQLEALQAELHQAHSNLKTLEDQRDKAQNALAQTASERDKALKDLQKAQAESLTNAKFQTTAATTEGNAAQIATAQIATTAPIDSAIAKQSTSPKDIQSAPIDNHAAAIASVRNIQFAQNGNGMDVILDMNAPVDKIENIDMGMQKSMLRIAGVALPDNFNKKFDTSAFNKGVKFVDSMQKDGALEIVAQSSTRTIDSIEQSGNRITWHIRPLQEQTAASYQSQIDRRQNAMISAAEPSTYELSTNYGAQKSLKDSPLAKRKITLDIHDADINDLLRLLSDEINTSIVVSPDVKGNVTLSLKSVPLDQALDIILRMHNLGMRYEGNIIWIAKAETFRAEEERALKAAEVRERLEPLEVRLIPVNYATASDLQGNVSSLLSSRGSVNIDTRTNTLILKDVAANLDAAEILVNNLDTQTPQILIEARIVETQANFTKEIGIQWGGDGIASAQTGNATGIIFPSTVGIAGGSTSDNNSGTSSSPNFAVNLPASVGTGSGGAIGLSLGSIGGTINLNIRLSSMEEKGFLKIVSAPRIMTLDNVQASIQQGTSIPISVVSAAGAQTVFYDAKLNLDVTPHVTRDGNVYLKINISKNEPDFGNTGANGDPSIIQKQAHTELLIPDGETTVIGGIYTRNTSQSMSSVPFFGSIPILGYLFKNTSETDNRTELLIFITPRIINKDASIAASGHGSFIPPVERSDDNKK